MVWLIDLPQLLSNPFYVGGDSYTGIVVLPLTLVISKGNKDVVPHINLRGYILGNPVIVRKTNDNSKVPYAHRMNLIPTRLYELLRSNCKGEYENVEPDSMECMKRVAAFKKNQSLVNYVPFL
ncbi:serine carboxypeptidase-like 18 [Cucurbita maxima]|uniref:Serine carboxypeptidase-like 18 n=1 Tax=Cucurbita maxima TaxID=3661 RepID=A0A6J1IK88_CUCMA|nr:serine carboxypeptidase-like 18 [Cucurbita maxima]